MPGSEVCMWTVQSALQKWLIPWTWTDMAFETISCGMGKVEMIS